MSESLLERFVAQINANLFFAEFAFPSAMLRVPGMGDLELADHLVLLDDVALIFQLKERDGDAKAEAADLSRWFASKVRKKAVRQIGDTKRLINEHAGTSIPNARGEFVQIPNATATRVASVVVFAAPQVHGFNPARYCISRSAGFVHFNNASDYLGVCQTLLTPTEVLDYLTFREKAVKSLVFAPQPVSETALVGQFMGGDLAAIPNERYAGALDALLADHETWDMSFLTSRLADQMTFREGDSPETAHRRILAELAKLTRAELKALKERLRLALEAADADEPRLPYRFAVPRTDCGFLVFPVTSALHAKLRTALHNYSVASKHELQVSKHVAMAVFKSGDYVDIVWMMLSGPPGPNPAVDALLESNYPFRPLREEMKPRYQFDSDQLRDAIGP